MDDNLADADQILLSILIPTYKRPELLAHALRSVAAQTRQANEVIVVDNDEEKSAVDTVKSFNQSIPKLKYIQASTRKGGAFSMNVAARAASGDWLVYLDDDDYWNREYLATVEQTIKSGGSNCIVTWIGYDFDGIIRGGKKMPRNITVDQIIRDGNPGFVDSNMAIERSLYESLEGLDESMPSSPDIDFLIRIIESGAIYSVIEEELTFLRQHSAARLTDIDSGNRAKGAAKLLEKHGHKVSWTARRKLKGRLHAGEFATTNSTASRWRHAIMSALNGDRSVTREFLRRPW
jgi:glycosyltransferase involved in cell wall biosynthesis